MLDIYGVFSQRMSKENAGRMALVIAMVAWFLIGMVVGAVLSLVLPGSNLNCILTFGSACSIVFGCVGQMIAILRAE